MTVNAFRPCPPVIWITGLAGAGKTTTAREVAASLRESYPCVLLVDGDSVREICGNDLGYDPESRLRNAYRISKLCKFLNDQGALVVCATISLFHEIHEWNRNNFPAYVEVYLKVSVATLNSRDQKGLYTSSTTKNCLAGVTQSYEEPRYPHLVLNNTASDDLVKNKHEIIKAALHYVTA